MHVMLFRWLPRVSRVSLCAPTGGCRAHPGSKNVHFMTMCTYVSAIQRSRMCPFRPVKGHSPLSVQSISLTDDTRPAIARSALDVAFLSCTWLWGAIYSRSLSVLQPVLDICDKKTAVNILTSRLWLWTIAARSSAGDVDVMLSAESTRGVQTVHTADDVVRVAMDMKFHIIH